MHDYSNRLQASIPGGAHTYSRGVDQFSKNSPPLLKGGKGVTVWTPEGEEFFDFGMALRAVTLGYGEPRVNAAAISQIQLGNNLTRPSLIELEAAESIISHFPSIEMVKFAKNGSNVTTAAIKLARAFTGRKKVIIPEEQPFFSFDDWFISGTPMSRGTEPNSSKNIIRVRYGDMNQLIDVFRENPGDIAAVMLEPISGNLNPCANHNSAPFRVQSPCKTCPLADISFLKKVESLVTANGALLILDEMITGFRWHLEGAASYFDIRPDMVTYGKAAANGFSFAFLGGRADVMKLGGINEEGMERVFLLSSTHGGEMSSLGAFAQTLQIYQTEGIVERLWEIAHLYQDLFVAAIEKHHMERNVEVGGSLLLPVLAFRDNDGTPSPLLRTLFQHAMTEKGVLMPWISYSLGHEAPEVVAATSKAFSYALERLDQVNKSPSLSPFPSTDNLRPVFRKFN